MIQRLVELLVTSGQQPALNLSLRTMNCRRNLGSVKLDCVNPALGCSEVTDLIADPGVPCALLETVQFNCSNEIAKGC